jgi:hypothetical protein
MVRALVRLPMLARARQQAGLNTANSSAAIALALGGYDRALWSAKRLAASHVVFQPGVNEELAATALWGTATGVRRRQQEVRRRVRHLVRQGRAWTAAPTSSSTPTSRALRRTAA